MRRRPITSLERLSLVAILAAACATAPTPGEEEADAGFINSVDAAVIPPDAFVPVPVTMNQSTSPNFEAGSVACIASVGGVPDYTRDNSYYRVFDLSQMGVTRDLEVSKVSIGIESAVSGAGGTQPVTVKLHSLAGSFVKTNLTELNSVPVFVADQANQMLDVNIQGTVPAASQLVVEISIPDADGGPKHLFFVGSNTLGESGPSYISSTVCGFPEPVALSTLLVNNAPVVMHLLMSVTGTF